MDQMPLLSALYGLKWDDVETMPIAELRSYLEQMRNVRRMRSQVEMVSFDG